MADTPRTYEIRWLIGIMSCAFIVRFIGISHPAEVVYDEVHHGGFVNSYLDGSYFFDIHPPLGKLLLYAWSSLMGYVGEYDFSAIGNSLMSSENYVRMRAFPSICGTLHVGLAFATVRVLKGSLQAAILSSVMLAFENLHIVMSRFLLPDAIMWCGMAVVVLCLAQMRRQEALSVDQYRWLLATGASLGFVMSIKWSALPLFAAVMLINAGDILWLYQRRPFTATRKDALNRLVVLTGIPVLFYVMSIFVHFSLLTRPGPGLEFHSPKFMRLLDSKWDMDAFLFKLKELFFVSWSVILNSPKQEAPGESVWTSWPLEWCTGVAGWGKYDLRLRNMLVDQYVLVIGNIVVFYVVLGSLVLFLWALLVQSGIVGKRLGSSIWVDTVELDTANGVTTAVRVETLQSTRRAWEILQRCRDFTRVAGMLVAGYVICLASYAYVSHVTFIYGYGPSLYMGILLIGFAWDAFGGGSWKMMFALIFLAISNFYMMYPLNVGWSISEETFWTRRCL